jgi:hypothetical protein
MMMLNFVTEHRFKLPPQSILTYHALRRNVVARLRHRPAAAAAAAAANSSPRGVKNNSSLQ